MQPASQSVSTYHIRVKGYLDPKWSEWFAGLTISHTNEGETDLLGPIIDQAELHGLLNKVRDLGLPLVSVMALEEKLQ